jgi:hypothetical protein
MPGVSYSKPPRWHYVTLAVVARRLIDEPHHEEIMEQWGFTEGPGEEGTQPPPPSTSPQPPPPQQLPSHQSPSCSSPLPSLMYMGDLGLEDFGGEPYGDTS